MCCVSISNQLFWPTLLDKIEEGRVIPVIGSRLVEVNLNGRTETLDSHLARRLCSRIRLEESIEPSTGWQLFDVVARAYGKDREGDYHCAINRLLKEGPRPPVPTALGSLARITDFRLYLSLTFDNLLVRALEEERKLIESDKLHLAYSPNQQCIDIPAPLTKLEEPLVFALFGKSCPAPEFVISDEDQLEWVTSLQDPDNRPPLLFDALRDNHLLFIGCGLPDWLQRFFIRLTRGDRFSLTRANETLIGPDVQTHTYLISFLERFSPKTMVLDMEPGDFVAELEERWLARKVEALEQQDDEPTLPPDMPPGGVFLSYASEDLDAARNLYGALRSRDIDTWFDTHRLTSGARYNDVISRNISRCGVMLILLSNSTLTRLERWRDQEGCLPDSKPYFLKEWELALSRAQLQSGSVTIMPFRIDNTSPRHSLIPLELRMLTVGYIPGGKASVSLIDAVKQGVRDTRKYRREHL